MKILPSLIDMAAFEVTLNKHFHVQKKRTMERISYIKKGGQK